uniref:Protamine-2 n=1 Tax=Rousettus aegyptiacus TaxID=9407 RepID=A0A7J8F2Q8_ROUAE|nr:protamine 2 [Rousettus aegyptiacus]
MVRHRTRSPSETPQQGGQEQEQEPNTEDIQVDGRTLRGRYHYRRRHCSRRRLYRVHRRRRCSCRRRRRRACRHRRHRRGCRRSRRRRRCRRRH